MFSFQLQPPGFMCAYYVGVLLTIVSPCICGSQFNTCFEYWCTSGEWQHWVN